MTFISLFAGIGGFDLGLERAGMRCVFQVEVDPYCRRVLERHWPEVPKRGDIRLVDPTDLPRADLVCGGFPCQDISVAGKRVGLEGKRSRLWHEFIRLVTALRPGWVAIENVAHSWGQWVPRLRSELFALGYASVPVRVRASELGADHHRARVFVLAHADRATVQLLSGWIRRPCGTVASEPLDDRWGHAASSLRRGDDGLSRRLALKALGNAVVPQVAEVIGRAIVQAARPSEGKE